MIIGILVLGEHPPKHWSESLFRQSSQSRMTMSTRWKAKSNVKNNGMIFSPTPDLNVALIITDIIFLNDRATQEGPLSRMEEQ